MPDHITSQQDLPPLPSVRRAVYTIPRFATELGISERTVRRLIDAGKINTVPLSEQRVGVPASEIDKVAAGGLYLPGAEVWDHRDAELVLAGVNDGRRTMKAPPLLRDDPTTENVVRERLRDLDAQRRQARRLAAKAEKAAKVAEAAR
jgi:hypothetical protein